jgi:hypothetical protein
MILLKKREKYAKDLPDQEFKKRYGDDWKSVKIATATKMAKKEERLPDYGTPESTARAKKMTPGQNEACWSGYKQVGMKPKGGKMVPNCVAEYGGPPISRKTYLLKILILRIEKAHSLRDITQVLRRLQRLHVIDTLRSMERKPTMMRLLINLHPAIKPQRRNRLNILK